MFQGLLDFIKQKLKELGFGALIEHESWQVESIVLIISIGLLGSLFTTLWRVIVWGIRESRQKRLKKDLHPYYLQSDIRNATQYYVPTHFQSNTPSQHSELIQANKVTARQKLIPFFLNFAFSPGYSEQRFYMILAGSGMGKTTFLINLYMKYITRWFVRGPRFHIYLLPLGYPNVLKRIETIPDPENTILLLDGLDEDPRAVKDYKQRLGKILSKVQDFRVVVFTCRTQFFPSEEEEPKETGVVKFGSRQGYQTFAKLYLSPFSERDIQKYLNKKYSWFSQSKKQKAKKIIKQSPNLMVRPMILSYMDDLIQEGKKYEYTSHLYQELIGKWIDREAGRVQEERRNKFREELYRFSREVALNIYRNRKHRNGLFISENEIKPLAERHKIELEEIEMKSRSLLNRNALGQYKFAHKSILEYFLAVEATEDASFAAAMSYEGMDQARVFFDEICLSRNTLPLFQRSKNKGEFRIGESDVRDPASVIPQELKKITHLKFVEIRELDALRPLKNLRALHLNDTQVKDIAALQAMCDLEELLLRNTPVEDLRPIQQLTGMLKLNLDDTKVSDISPLQGMQRMKTLSFANTFVEDISPLYNMFELEKVVFHHTRVKDLNPVRKLKNLHTLIFNNTPISVLGPLRELTNLHTLSCGYSKINNLSPLRTMIQLQNLSIHYTEVTSLKPLYDLHNLHHLELTGKNFPPGEIEKFQSALPQCKVKIR
ncbi:MAG: leucine-rich repeat domain-containing protein [Bacteroidia bacterium]|nr:leucine-rich repeat domain-containing protein [Bacteroidia bacterium]